MFTDDMTDLISVDGTLTTGSSHINTNDLYDYNGSLPIKWLFYDQYSGSLKFSSKDVYADFLMSGTQANYGDWVEIDWSKDLINGLLVLDSSLSIYTDRFPGSDPHPGNTVNYFDPMVFYSINSPTPTPEPAILLLLGLGLAGVAGIRRFKK